MRLIKCHIEGYGKLINKDIDFDSKLTEFSESNGFGKTSIASFIKAMLYGLKPVKSNSAEFLDRAHFYPFTGSAFGGSLTLEFNNKEYKIERTFDSKSDTRDTLTIYANGDLTNELGKIPGEKIFGLNKESFERTIFIDANTLSIGISSDINQKLNNGINSLDEDFDLSAVLKKLNEKNAKKQEISELKKALSNTEEEIKNINGISNNLSKKYADLKNIEFEIGAIEKEKNEILSKNDKINAWKFYDERAKEIEGIKQNITNINAKYQNDIPAVEELSTTASALHSNETNIALKNSKRISDDDIKKLKFYENVFFEAVPAADEIENKRNKIKAYDEALANINNTLKPDEALISTFSNKDINDETINCLKNHIDEYKGLRDEYNQIPSTILQTTSVKKEKRSIKLNIILLIASIILIGAGIASLFAINALGIILICAGIALLMLDGFIYLKSAIGASQNSTTSIQIPNNAKIAAKDNLDAKANKINEILVPLGFFDSDPCIAYEKLVIKYELYKGEILKKEEALESIKQNQKCINIIKNELDEFFNKYQIKASDYNSAITDLSIAIREYIKLKKAYDDYCVEMLKLDKEIQKNNEIIEAFKNKYNIEATKNNIKSINDDILDLKHFNEDLDKKTNSLIQYKNEQMLDERPASLELISIPDFQDKLDELNSQHRALYASINSDEEIASTLEAKENKKADIEENIDNLNRKKYIYDKTIEALKRADEAQNERYVGPVKERFLSYSKIIKAVIGDDIMMNKKYEISYDANGIQRSSKHLSAGELEICVLCFRLALIDKMFENESPIIIMDDPFVGLDKNNMENVKKLINGFDNRQFIYFNCHESRSLK